jgi:hypothetical protein
MLVKLTPDLSCSQFYQNLTSNFPAIHFCTKKVTTQTLDKTKTLVRSTPDLLTFKKSLSVKILCQKLHTSKLDTEKQLLSLIFSDM